MDRVAVKAAEIEDAQARILGSALKDLETAAAIMRRASGSLKALEIYAAESSRASGLAASADDLTKKIRQVAG